MKFTKRTIAGAVAGFVLAGGAAFAAVSLWGSGDAAVAATTAQGLTIDNVRLDRSLVPGGTSSAAADVHNPNDFSVKVTGVIVLDEGQTVTGCTDAASVGSVSLNGGSAATTIVTAGGPSKSGKLFTLAAPVTLAPHGAVTVTVADVVKQASTADQFCGFTAKLGLQAETAGN